MEQRVIKFRAWDGRKMITEETHTVGEIVDRWYEWELMQYTGLKDKNGTPIYEGDIVQNHHYPPSTVFFREGSFCTHLSLGKWLEFSQNSFGVDSYEVIGNIYENPELLPTAPEAPQP